ncbi:MAG TPA: hypothetical protein VD758_08595, partial [Gemmatimonadaceae bacterium]|nr:hypothetical protein [Gemmatimonadaceae bacterium]
QPKLVWPASFALARAYVDQLERSNGLAKARITTIRSALSKAEAASATQRKADLRQLSTSLSADVRASSDASKVRMLAAAVKDLAR